MLYRDPIHLAHDVAVQLTSLSQEAHYEGLLEGLPTREMNERMLASLKRDGIHLVWAPETLIPWVEARPYPFGVPAQLPPVRCIARVGTPDDGLHVRVARLAWFQHAWAFPIAPEVLRALLSIEWDVISTREEL